MLNLRIILAIFTVFPRGTGSALAPHAVGFEEVIEEVQEAIRKLVLHRSNLLQDQMRNECQDRDFLVMKVNIVKGPPKNASIYENYAFWTEMCVFYVYDAGVISLQKWCFEDPARHLIYKQNSSESVLEGPKMIVDTKCHMFEVDSEEYYRNLAESFFKIFLIISTVSLILILINWFFRRDIVVVVNQATDKMKTIEGNLAEKSYERKTNEAENDDLLLLEHEETN
ncbi:unnamed protein product [Caenorhabditis sp. 36 PRJEB53466]|nr:unnamed protein product [Caenorhabditis sp. 36 PRJEB53466]